MTSNRRITVYGEIFEWLNFWKSRPSATSKTLFLKMEQGFSYLSLLFSYRIAINFGGAKLWRIAFLSPNITLQNSPNCAQWLTWCSFRQSLTLQNLYGDLFAKVWHHQSLALYGILKLYFRKHHSFQNFRKFCHSKISMYTVVQWHHSESADIAVDNVNL